VQFGREIHRRMRHSNRHLGALSALAGLTLLAAGAAVADALPLIPWPREVSESGGAFQLTGHTTIRYEAAAASGAASLVSRLHVRRSDAGAAIVLRVDPSTELGAEGYRLIVEPGGISIDAATERGLYYGVQTLLQLVPANCTRSCQVPAVRIVDAPRFEWRGLLVDISRHFFGKSALLRIIDEMAALKLNVLHLHLTDDAGWRFEVPAYPQLTGVGARGDEETPGVGPPRFLSRRDVHELVEYARARYIEIVPEIELLAHCGAAARAYPRLFDGERSINPAREASMNFAREVLAEAARQFPSRYLHFGGDEFGGSAWDKLPDVQLLRERAGLHSERELEGYFDNQLVQSITTLGRQAMAWDEAAEAGVRGEVLIQWWRKDRPEVLAAAIRNGHDVVLSPVDQVYFDYPNALGEPGAPWEGNDNGPTSVGKILRWEPVPPRLTSAEIRHIRGLEAALWTEFIRSERYLQFMLYPRLQAFAEVAWSEQAVHDPADFRRRLDPHLRRMAGKGVHARRGPEDAVQFQIH
jgi:hexosaminidase